ncbi:MAG TPA: copper transporter [Solirubrobacterales bacterium]|nr:copper transporter [Solirubrobacterales bacterium]
MGYSGRYHAASLAAVFIALAIGILIGVGLADDVVSGTSEALEDSLRSDLDEAEQRRDELGGELEREQKFGERVYPAVVSGRLAGSSIAVVAVGGLSDEVVADIEEAVEPAGATVEARAVIAVPADPAAIADDAPPRFNPARRGGAGLERLGRAVGAGLIGGSGVGDRVRGSVFERFSGSLEDVDRVVFVGSSLGGLEPGEREDTEALLQGIIDGVERNAAGVVAVERTDTEPGTLLPFSSSGIATVDHVDLVAGRVATVFSLLGAGGDYGVKEGADSFLPDLINPAPASGAGTPEQ